MLGGDRSRPSRRARGAVAYLLALAALTALWPGCTLAFGYPPAQGETCGNGEDDDLDGARDCDDPDCFDSASCAPALSWQAGSGAPASPPTFVCPTGWRTVLGADGATTCDPYPEGGASACAAGMAHFPGEPACAPIGRACPAGDWPDDLPAVDVVYVRADAGAGGDGTRDRPLTSVVAALAQVTSGGTVVLARGTYEEPITLSMQTVTIRGACVAETRITATAPPGGPAPVLVNVSGGDVTVEDVDIDGAGGAQGPSVAAGGELTLRGVHIAHTPGYGVLAVGSTLHVQDTLVEDVGTIDSAFGVGVGLSGASDVTVERTVISRPHGVGVAAEQDFTGSCALRDAVVRDVRLFRGTGIGVLLQGTGQGVVQRMLVEHAHLAGFLSAASLSLDDVVVRDVTRGDTIDEFAGHGIEAVWDGSGSLVAHQLLIERTADAAILASGVDLDLDGVVLRDVIERAPDGLFGAGVIMITADEARVAHALVTGTVAEGFRAARGATMSIDHTVLTGLGGPGVVVDLAGEADLTHVLIEDVVGAGVYASDRGSLASVSDTLVRRVAPRGDGLGGFGLAFESSSLGQLKAVEIRDAASVGVLADQSVVVGTDVLIHGTRSPACAATCGGGVAVSTSRADVALHRFVVEGATACAAQLSNGGSLGVSTGQLRDVPAAMCIDASSTAPTSGFVYEGAGALVDASPRAVPTVLPLPDRVGR